MIAYQGQLAPKLLRMFVEKCDTRSNNGENIMHTRVGDGRSRIYIGTVQTQAGGGAAITAMEYGGGTRASL